MKPDNPLCRYSGEGRNPAMNNASKAGKTKVLEWSKFTRQLITWQ